MNQDENILNPITDDSPTGENLRLVSGDLTLRRIEELMNEGEVGFDGEERVADWRGVARECETALAERTKDLELTAFLTLARVCTQGFGGLRDGLKVSRGLLETYWDRLHPGYEDDEIILGIRGRPLTWMGTSDRFIQAVKRVPITSTSGMRALSWFDYEETERVDEAQRMSDQTLFNELREQDKKTSEEWLAALSATPPDKLFQAVEEIKECEKELGELNQLCEERFEDEAPSLMKLESLLNDVREYLVNRVGGGAADEAAEGAGEYDLSSEPEGAAEGARVSHAAAGPISTRAEAIQRLREVAGFLRRTEPHSPISFLVERAAKWGDLPFEDVMKEIVKSPDALDHVWETLGIVPPDEESG